MKSRKLLVLCTLAVAAALAIGYFSTSTPYYEQLIRIQAEQQLGPIDKNIGNEPLDIQAMLLDYSGDKTLTLKAWIALSKYPAQTREVLRLYGSEPEFQDVLRRFGEPVIPVVKYFLDNDVLTLKVMETVKSAGQSIGNSATAAWNWATGKVATPPNANANPQQNSLGPTERGRYAINFVRGEGHQFLGQFDVDIQGQAHWNQTNRVVIGVSSFFTSGISNLERKYDLHDEVKINDVFFAGIDVIPMVAALKLLQAGKMVAASGKELSLVSRTRIYGAKLIPKSGVFLRLGKYAAIAATVYIVASHPSLINSLFEEAAKLLGLDPWLVQFVGWAILITLLLYPFSWVLMILARVVLLGLSWLERPRVKNVRA